MYIVIIGGGRIGYYLTKTLLNEGHEVVIVEKEAPLVETLNNEFGSVCVQGDGCELATLIKVGTERADMFIAVTGEDPDNLVSCQIAKHRFNVKRTVARIRNPINEPLFKKLGVDVIVSGTNVILEYIQDEVPTHSLTHLLDIEEGEAIVVIKIPENAETIGQPIRNLEISDDNKLLLVINADRKNRIPTKNTIIKAGDRIIATTTRDKEEDLRRSLTGLE
ncbi:MAG: TrkA family potassium uptake protein [Dehalococcoidales bacterium]|jgi:trk system potassium uptake protein TrkA|nr:TrkA family potassium uptake protein [Dehalococcoidales bacterium]